MKDSEVKSKILALRQSDGREIMLEVINEVIENTAQTIMDEVESTETSMDITQLKLLWARKQIYEEIKELPDMLIAKYGETEGIDITESMDLV